MTVDETALREAVDVHSSASVILKTMDHAGTERTLDDLVDINRDLEALGYESGQEGSLRRMVLDCIDAVNSGHGWHSLIRRNMTTVKVALAEEVCHKALEFVYPDE